MDSYFRRYPYPSLAFTPDADYGICVAEKGVLHVRIHIPQHDGTTLTEFHAGTAVNAVPDSAYVLLNCTENEDHQLQRLADAKKGNYELCYTIDGLKIISYGTSAHGSTPELGFNAATHLIRLLSSNFGHKVLGSICSFIDSAIGLDLHGSSLGIQSRDKSSGRLTVNVGCVHIDSRAAFADLDIRYPVSETMNAIIEKIKRKAERENVNVSVRLHQAPLSVPDNHPIIPLLKNAYRTMTGEDPLLYSTGGCTYARTLQGNGVAFGPIFPGENPHLHDADEQISLQKLMLHAQICLQAMFEFYTASL